MRSTRPIQRLLVKKEKGFESGLGPEIFTSGLVIPFLAESTCEVRLLVGVVSMKDTGPVKLGELQASQRRSRG